MPKYPKRRSVVIGNKLWSRLKALAENEERAVSDLLREAAVKLLESRERGEKGYDPVTETYNRSLNLD